MVLLDMTARRDLRFRFAPDKALSAIHWMVWEMARKGADLDLHTMLKSCYFADKAQLNAHDQPIFGATYRAMRFGPVPLEIYEMAKGEALWLAELGLDAFPWQLQGYRLHLVGNSEPDVSVFTADERRAIEAGLALSGRLTFSARTAATHGRDWQAADLGIMRYEDMFDEGTRSEEDLEHLRASAPFLKL